MYEFIKPKLKPIKESVEKKIYWIRHGKAEHNIEFEKIGEQAYFTIRDSKLVEEGIQQANALNSTWNKQEIQKVFVSPLSRTLETANIVFKNSNVKLIATDDIIEFNQGIHLANKRKTRTEILENFPNVQFNGSEYSFWNGVREKKYELKYRLHLFLNKIKEIDETIIAVVTHNDVIRYVFENIDEFTNIDNLQHENKSLPDVIDYCTPYVYYHI